MADYILPVFICAIILMGLICRADCYQHFLDGTREGLLAAVRIAPSLIGLLAAIGMMRVSGLLDGLASLLSPVTRLLHIPQELLPLMLMRPISGSGSLAIVSDLLHTYGADSRVGFMAAVMMGSTETTFYAISVYFGAAGIHKTRYTLAAALTADLVGMMVCVLIC